MRRRQCTRTGLSIVEGPVTMYRVAVSAYGRGPLNPMLRPADPALDRRDWNRFDTPELTVYGADKRATAFTESIAYKAPSARDYAGLAEEAAFLGVGLDELHSLGVPVDGLDELLDELRSLGVPVDGLDSDWRLAREVYTLEFTSRTWVDLAHPDGCGREGLRHRRRRPADPSGPHGRRPGGDHEGGPVDPRSGARQWDRTGWPAVSVQVRLRRRRLLLGCLPRRRRWAGGFSAGESLSASDGDLRTAMRRTGVSVS